MTVDIQATLARHERIAFQLSGGADSVAALYVMRPSWNLMTIYHLDTGDSFPEKQAVIGRIEQDIHLTHIQADVRRYRAEIGLASDVVPFDNTPVGRGLSGRTLRIVSRMECCAANVMLPLHQRMLDEDVTLLIRGTRADEFKGGLPLRSGHVETDAAGRSVELLHPIEDWSKQKVIDFCADQGLPVTPFYSYGMSTSPECKGCTAWWSDGRMAYLRQHHSAEAVAYDKNLRAIRGKILRQMATCLEELQREQAAI